MIYAQFFEKNREGQLWPVEMLQVLEGKESVGTQIRQLLITDSEGSAFFKREFVSHVLVFSTDSECETRLFSLEVETKTTVHLNPV